MTRIPRPTRALAALVLLVAQSAAFGQAWPTRPVHFVVPFSAGGANDLMARAAAEGAARVLGQPVIVDNRPGAGTVLGTNIVAKSAPDGYTFLISAAGVVSNSMIRPVPYKDADLVPVVMIGLAPSVVVAPANAPYRDLKDFIASSAKSEKGLNFATAGTGSTPHFVEGLLDKNYHAKLNVVPYKSGSESINAVLGGQVEATSEASIVVLPFIKSGKLKPLATTWTQRISAYPELSTATEQGYGDIRIAHWAGLHAPAGTPPEIMDRLAAAVDRAMKDPATVTRLKDLGIEPVGGTRASFTKFVDEERARLGAVVKATGMKGD